jgi:MFS family permease
MRGPDEVGNTTSRPAITSPLGSMWALFLGVGLMMVGNGLQGTLLGVRSSIEAFDTTVIGFIQAAYYVGFLVGSRFTMRALGRVGHVRVFAALASSASTAALVHSIFINAPTWTLMRFVTGFCMAGLFIVAESWLNEQATPETRGRTLSIYMVVTMAGITGGQFLLNVADPGSFELFVLASVLVSMSLVPMALSESSTPPVISTQTLPFRELFAVVPTGVVTMFFSGAAAGSIFAFGPVYAAQIGMTTGQISLFLSAALIGAMIFQMPIGALSDRVSRRGVMAVAATVATGASAVGLATDTGFSATVVMFVIGSTSFPIYSLAIAYTNDWIEPTQRIGASGLLVMINGVGAIIGPLVAATLMTVFTPSAYFWSLIVTHGAIAAYVTFRIVVGDPVPIADQTAYQPIPARSSAVVAVIGRLRSRSSSHPR